jgi:hypothetical protein
MNRKECPDRLCSQKENTPIDGKAMNEKTSSVETEVRQRAVTATPKLVNGQRLLEELFDEDSRPSLRTLRNWTAAKAIPFVRLGHLVFFFVPDVKSALEKRHTIKAKGVQ